MSHLTPDQIERACTHPSEFAHLASCVACQQSVSDATARQRLLAGLTRYTLSDMAFRRVEARLAEQLEEGLPSAARRWAWLWWAVPIGVAVAMAVFIRPLLSGPVAPSLASVNKAPSAFEPAQVAELTVLRSSPDARSRRGTDPWAKLSPGDVLRQGDAVFGTSIRCAPSETLDWSFELSGAAVVGGGGALALGAGELLASVKAGRADIVAGPLHVVASDAVFSVNRVAAEVVVDVAFGSVEVVNGGTYERRTVRAPTRVRWAEGAALSVASESVTQGVAMAPAPVRPWVLFDVSQLPAGSTILLDGVDVSGASQLVSSGRHRLSIAGPGQVARESWLELTQGYVVELPKAPDLKQPAPDAEAVRRLQDELRRQRPKLATCYEKWLKANPAASATVELHLTVTASGRVRDAKRMGGAIAPASEECLLRTLRSLTLPSLGAEVELELPLLLTHEAK